MNELITPTQDDTKAQPSALSIKTACVLFAGPVVTFRSFKQGAPRSLRGIADTEFTAAIEDLQNSSWGTVRRLRIPRTANQVKVFVKQEPDDIVWPKQLCSQDEYKLKYQQPSPKSISPAIKRALIANNYANSDLFPDID